MIYADLPTLAMIVKRSSTVTYFTCFAEKYQ